MVRPLLAALLLGMVPVSTMPIKEVPIVSLQHVSIAPPLTALTVKQRLSASGILIADLEGGQFLYGKQSRVRQPMASLTKLMTALIIVENHDLREWVTVSRASEEIDGNKSYLPPGEQFTVGGLLSALLIASANDAAHVLATFHSGSVRAFVEEMNTRAQALGLRDTQFANPSGLDSSLQWSTPQNLAWLANFVLHKEEIRSRMERRGIRIVSRQGTEIPLTHTHALLHANTPVVAGKTGTTDGAKECLLSVVESGGREYVVIIMHSLERYADMRKLLSVFEEALEVL